MATLVRRPVSAGHRTGIFGLDTWFRFGGSSRQPRSFVLGQGFDLGRSPNRERDAKLLAIGPVSAGPLTTTQTSDAMA
jgi:hypothetical protein